MIETARQRITQLVEDFQQRTDAELRRMNEAQTRLSFIDPLFRALGWDVTNPDEVSVEVSEARRRVDYTFRLNRVTRFIVEAKAPHVDLTREEFVRQAVTYAYNKGVNWAVLTNFKELRVFSAEEGRPLPFLSLGYQNYLENLENLWRLSKPSWESGLFEREATQYGALRPRVPVEKSLFDQLRQWRETLFNEIAKHNDGLSYLQIDELIQQFLNRLIFIRTAEDRGIEEHLLLATLHQWQDGHRGRLLNNLRAIFTEFAHRYDSDLFPNSDPWASVFVEDPTLETILQGLYQRPRSLAGYDFAAIDPDVLGAVYEQYLGHVPQVVRERANREAVQARLFGLETPSIEMEAKKERRKAQGIYYTPKWVVDYIVQQTVGRFLAERSHDEIINMKILDPACGSGSFLIRAYDELLTYHARVQGKTPSELGWAERISILTRNIFGVDLDDQAVQIARLNLLLRALNTRVELPPLADNIRRGNSLISGGEAELKPYFGDAWQEKRPFTWEQQFPTIMARGGFDVVIGNPPYIDSEWMTRTDPTLRVYCNTRYSSAQGNWDVFCIFVEKSLNVLRKSGLSSMIVPNKLLAADYASALRRFLAQNHRVLALRDYSRVPVFPSGVYPIVYVAEAQNPTRTGFLETEQMGISNGSIDVAEKAEIPWKEVVDLNGEPWSGIIGYGHAALLRKIRQGSVTLGDIAFVGGAATVSEAYEYKSLIVEHNASLKHYLGFANTGTIDRYSIRWGIRPTRYLNSTFKQPVIPQSAWPNLPMKRLAQARSPKIIIAGMTKGLECAYDEGTFLAGKSTSIVLSDSLDLRYLLGLLNSKLMTYYFIEQFESLRLQGGFRRVGPPQVRQLPVHVPEPSDLDHHDRLVALVEGMLELQRRKLDMSLLQSDREDIEREIARVDQEIDNLVYDLYGLTEEERRLVEEGTRP